MRFPLEEGQHLRGLRDESLRLGPVEEGADLRLQIAQRFGAGVGNACGHGRLAHRDPDHARGIRRGAAEQRLLFHHQHVEALVRGRDRRRETAGPAAGHQHIAFVAIHHPAFVRISSRSGLR